MKINKIKNFKELGEKLKEITKCDEFKLKIINESNNHFHFGMIKNNYSLAVICYNDGEISIAPFENVDNDIPNECYLSIGCLVFLNEFIDLMNGIKSLVIE